MWSRQCAVKATSPVGQDLRGAHLLRLCRNQQTSTLDAACLWQVETADPLDHHPVAPYDFALRVLSPCLLVALLLRGVEGLPRLSSCQQDTVDVKCAVHLSTSVNSTELQSHDKHSEHITDLCSILRLQIEILSRPRPFTGIPAYSRRIMLGIVT